MLILFFKNSKYQYYHTSNEGKTFIEAYKLLMEGNFLFMKLFFLQACEFLDQYCNRATKTSQ